MPKVETIVYRGIKFRRYPDSDRLEHVRYFRPASNHIRRGVSFLHREIWKDAHGEIPKGHHIHHRDGNWLNNDLSNLECLTVSEHMKHHPIRDMKKQLRHLKNIRPSAAPWHATKEGRQWHSEHGKDVWREKVKKGFPKFKCVVCGKEKEDRSSDRCAKVCSGKCAQALFRSEKRYHEDRKCKVCGKKFKVNKYAKTKTCSPKCGAALRKRK